MATVLKPNSVAARKTRMAISLRLATRSFRKGRFSPAGLGPSSRRATVMSRVFIPRTDDYSNEQIGGTAKPARVSLLLSAGSGQTPRDIDFVQQLQHMPDVIGVIAQDQQPGAFHNHDAAPGHSGQRGQSGSHLRSEE